MSLIRFLVTLLALVCTQPAFAQWTPVGADLAGRFGKWRVAQTLR